MAELGGRIRELRKARGWTQKQLAERAGLSEITIKTMEANKYSPRSDTLASVARALDVPVSTLYGEGDILDGPFPAANLRDWGLAEAFLLRYAKLWPDLRREQRAWLIGHLRIVADAERKIRTLEGGAEGGEPDDPPEPARYGEIIPQRIQMETSGSQ